MLCYICIPYFLLMFLMLLDRPCVYLMIKCPLHFLLVLCCSGCLSCWCLWFLLCILFRAHLGYSQWFSASCKCCSYVPSSFGVEHTVMALYVGVLMTLYLEAMWWWLSYYKYWSVCVRSLCTPVSSCVSVIMVSRKGTAPSYLMSSIVNLIDLSMELM